MRKEEEQATFAASRSSAAGLGARGELCLAEKGERREMYMVTIMRRGRKEICWWLCRG